MPNTPQDKSTSKTTQQPRILILVTEDWFFLSHRLALGQHLLKSGFSVAVACRVNNEGERIRKYGFELYDIPFAREKVGPIPVLKASLALRRAIHAHNSDIIMTVALRAIMLGWMATVGNPNLPVINLMVGRGSLFTGINNSLRMRITKTIVNTMFRTIFRRNKSHNVFLNEDDINLFTKSGWSRPNQSYMIPGPGIDTKKWQPQQEPDNHPPVILYVGRLLRDKGVLELVQASRILRKNNIQHRLLIAGRIDDCNPNAISEKEVKQWTENFGVEWLGQRSDVLQLMTQANIIAMPSYLEGFGRVLLEAGLARRAVVTCDTVGCRQAVRHMDNGILVQPRNHQQLADALELLITDPILRNKLAIRHYERIRTEFSDEAILPQYSSLCSNILSSNTAK